MGKYLKAHLKYRDTEACETSANDREKCALKWLFVELVVETDTLKTQNKICKLWKITRVQIPKEPPAKAVLKMRMESPNLLEN
nr:MAG TPA: hypothetical protein [Caudoviricetes sp.]